MQARQKLLECFRNCDHLFSISSQRTFVDNRRPYLGFIALIDRLYAIAQEDEKLRRIGWIVDQMDMRHLYTSLDVSKFDNLQQLRSRLLAYGVRYEEGARMRWLCDHGRVFVRNEDAQDGPLDLLFGDWIPESWAADATFCDAYGDKHERLNELCIMAFWSGDELTCYANYMRDNVPHLALLPHPGKEYANTLRKFRGAAPQVDDIRSLTITDFIDAF
jgi:hypothetical protein